MACNLFNHQKPVKIVATGHLMETGVDECCTIVLLYPNQRIASMNVSINCAKFTPAFIIGEKGTIQVIKINQKYFWLYSRYSHVVT